MYEYIKGQLASLEPTQAVIDCSGVGYLLEITLNTYEALRRADAARPRKRAGKQQTRYQNKSFHYHEISDE